MPNSLTLRLALFTAATASLVAVQLAFWPLWLASRGLDATEIGVVLGASSWVRVVMTPIAGSTASSACFTALWPLGDNVILSARVDYGRVKLVGLPDLPARHAAGRARPGRSAAG